jgi:hypothetical protein
MIDLQIFTLKVSVGLFEPRLGTRPLSPKRSFSPKLFGVKTKVNSGPEIGLDYFRWKRKRFPIFFLPNKVALKKNR